MIGNCLTDSFSTFYFYKNWCLENPLKLGDEWSKLKLPKPKKLLGGSLAEGSSGDGRRESLPNKLKVLALNRTHEYFRLVKWYIRFNSDSKTFLHKNGYEKANRLFNKHRFNSDSQR